MPRWLRYSVVFGIALGAIALFGLVITSADTRLFEKYFPILLILNIAVATILFFVVVAMMWRLGHAWRAKHFGSRMTTRLALVTALIGLIPAVAIYFISAGFINRSIDSWFDVRVEGALDSGVNITRNILTKLQKNAEEQTKQLALSLANTPRAMLVDDLVKHIDASQGIEALVVTANGVTVAAAGSKINVLLPDMPGTFQLQAAQSTGVYSVIDGDAFDQHENSKNTLRIRVIVPINTVSIPDINAAQKSTSLLVPDTPQNQKLFLQTTQPIPDNIAGNATRLVEGYRDYQELTLSRASLRTIYGLTLTLTLLLTTFASITAALSFARKTTAPVLQLAQGTRRVATGDYEPIREFPGGDEINELTGSFNSMIKEISESRRSLDFQRQQAEQAQAFLGRILENISSGVVVLDEWSTIVTTNSAARQILGKDALIEGTSLEETAYDFALCIEKNKSCLTNENESHTFEYEFQTPSKSIPLYVRISAISLGAGSGSIVVFDDVTQLIMAQRATAWGEVARRLAHEIKNPLTPIRLAAERLEYKLEPHLQQEKDRALLHRTIQTIVTQVDALKDMVNDFRDYARLPTAKLKAMDINNFIKNAVTLYHNAGISVDLHLEEKLPKIDADASQTQQVVHNLISNSIDATSGLNTPNIQVTTQGVPSALKPNEITAVKLIIDDNGVGFSEKILQSAFEPYVTTKPTGTGLGLPMVKKIMDDHGASIQLSNRIDPISGEVSGARVEITFRIAQSPVNT